MVKCPRCGADVPPFRFCTNCGSPLEGTNQREQKQEISSENERTRVSEHLITPPNIKENIIRTKEEVIKCPLCREDVPKSHSYCYLCGANLHPEATHREQVLDLKVCPHCRKTNSPGVGFCMHCGLVLPTGKKNTITQLLQVSRTAPVMTVEDFNNFELNIIPTPPIDPEMQVQILKGLSMGKIMDHHLKNTRAEFSSFFEISIPGKQQRNLGLFTPFIGTNIIQFLAGWIIIFSLLLGWFFTQDDFIKFFDFNLLLQTNGITVILLLAGISFYVMWIQFLPSAMAIHSFYKKSGSILQFRLNFQQVTFLIFLNMIISFLGFFPMPLIFRLGMLDLTNTVDQNKLQKEDLKRLQDALGDGILLSIVFIIAQAMVMLSLFGFPGVMNSIMTLEFSSVEMDFFFEMTMLFAYGFIYFTGLFFVFTFPSVKDIYVQSFMKRHRATYIFTWVLLLIILFHIFSLLGEIIIFF